MSSGPSRDSSVNCHPTTTSASTTKRRSLLGAVSAFAAAAAGAASSAPGPAPLLAMASDQPGPEWRRRGSLQLQRASASAAGQQSHHSSLELRRPAHAGQSGSQQPAVLSVALNPATPAGDSKPRLSMLLLPFGSHLPFPRLEPSLSPHGDSQRAGNSSGSSPSFGAARRQPSARRQQDPPLPPTPSEAGPTAGLPPTPGIPPIPERKPILFSASFKFKSSDELVPDEEVAAPSPSATSQQHGGLLNTPPPLDQDPSRILCHSSITIRDPYDNPTYIIPASAGSEAWCASNVSERSAPEASYTTFDRRGSVLIGKQWVDIASSEGPSSSQAHTTHGTSRGASQTQTTTLLQQREESTSTDGHLEPIKRLQSARLGGGGPSLQDAMFSVGNQSDAIRFSGLGRAGERGRLSHKRGSLEGLGSPSWQFEIRGAVGSGRERYFVCCLAECAFSSPCE